MPVLGSKHLSHICLLPTNRFRKRHLNSAPAFQIKLKRGTDYFVNNAYLFQSALMEFWEELQPGLQPPGWVCIHRMGIRLQRLLLIALFLDPIELDQGATRAEVLSTKLRTWLFMACVFVEKLQKSGVVVPIHRALFYPTVFWKWIYLDLVGGGLEPVCTPQLECPARLWWHGLVIVLSYCCGIIRGKKTIRSKDRINLMSWCDTGGQEATVKNKDFFFWWFNSL